MVGNDPQNTEALRAPNATKAAAWRVSGAQKGANTAQAHFLGTKKKTKNGNMRRIVTID